MKTTLLITLCFLFLSCTTKAQDFPKEDWEINYNIEKDGWDITKLRQVRQYLIDSTNITGLLVVHKGKLISIYGDVIDNSYIASCRKSVLAMLYGPYVKSGEIDLDKTIEGLKIDDIGGLSAEEKKATIRDLISARSGVFHPASNGGDFLAYAPKRGSVKPGEYWLYSNWDFNVAGHIFEQETGVNIYDGIENIFARPMQMQDWDRSLQQKSGDLSKSKYKAYHMWFSTRDMARLGLLMLNKGKWRNKQILDSEWVDEMVTARSSKEELNANVPTFQQLGNEFSYGYMWWLWGKQKDPRMAGGYSAMGALGQTITVFPAIETVIAYKTNSIYQRDNYYEHRINVLKKIATAISLN